MFLQTKSRNSDFVKQQQQWWQHKQKQQTKNKKTMTTTTITENSQMKDTLVKGYYCQVWHILKTVKLKEQDHSYQHLSCTSPSLQFQNSQEVKKGNSADRLKKKESF